MANRAQYSDDIKAVVKAKYPLCRTPADRDALAQECGIGSRQKLYNLASRLFATRPHANSAAEWVEDEDGYDATQDFSRLQLRDNPAILEWTTDNRRYLREHFGKTFIESIAFMLNRSETACAYEARRMGLRNVPKYYDMRKIGAWLGLSSRELLLLSKHGLDIHPCTDRSGELAITLVSTTSLARVLIKDGFWKKLVDRRQADAYFIADIIESVVDLQKGIANWEPNCWVSHGHTCLNPFSDACFGWFYDGNDEKMAGADLDPRDLAPSANVSSDNWRRGTRALPQFEDEIEALAPELEIFEAEAPLPV
jgi:hypothetical protein